jgi:cysteine desulfurase
MLRLRRRAYLDNNATTEVSPRVQRVMRDVLKNCYGNPSSRYRIARAAAAILEDAREQVAIAIGADATEITFTGSASEANNQILLTFAAENSGGRDTIISTPIEHPAVLRTLEHLAGRGMRIVFCPVDTDGRLLPEDLASLIDERTALVCCMLANNETGVIQDIAPVVSLARQHGARVFVDCVQALGKMPVNVHQLDVDYASFSAHKIHGPKGVGALYARAGCPLAPLIHGGHQENGLRAGTEGLHNIAGFGLACREIPQLLARARPVAELRQRLMTTIRTLLPAAVFNTPLDCAVPNTLSVTLPGFDNGDAIAFLDYHGIAVSAGSACNTQANEPSHVLKAIGLSDEAARQTLRLSLSTETSAADIRYVERVLHDYLLERKAPVTMVNPTQINEDMLFNEQLFILDIRNKIDRKLLKGLPGSHEAALTTLGRYLDQIPRRRTILVVCQGGTDGPIAAYYLRAKGYRHVSFVMGGVVGWKLCQPELYKRLGNTNISVLEARKNNA